MQPVSQACQDVDEPFVVKFPETHAYIQRLHQENIELQEIIAKHEKELARKDRQIELLQQRVFSLQDSDAARHQRVVKDLDNALKRYQDRMEQYRRVGACKGLNGGDKWVLAAMEEEIAEHPERTRDDGFSLVYRDDIAYRAGCSATTVTDAYTRLEKHGVIEKRFLNKGSKSGEERVFIKINREYLLNPELINPKQDGKAGGSRHLCPQCAGELKRRVSVVYTCDSCGIDFDKDGSPIDHTHEHQQQAAPVVDDVRARIDAAMERVKAGSRARRCHRPDLHEGLYWKDGMTGKYCLRCEPNGL